MASAVVSPTGFSVGQAHLYDRVRLFDGYKPHMSNGLIVVLNNARDGNWQNCGAGLFHEILKGDLREVRSTIEAYSRTARISGHEDSSACGYFCCCAASHSSIP
jgi:hypothetical protein